MMAALPSPRRLNKNTYNCVASSDGWDERKAMNSLPNEDKEEAEQINPMDELFARYGVAMVPIEEYKRLQKIEVIVRRMLKSKGAITSGWRLLEDVFD